MRDLSSSFAATPRARRALRQFGLDGARITGSGPNGRIVEADVLAFLRRAPAANTSSMRQMIAQRTTESAATIPHFYLRAEVDVTPLVEVRKQIVETVEQRDSVKISYTDFLLRAIAFALRELPRANAVWENNGLAALVESSVGLVVALSEGLMIPVIGRPDTRGIVEIARERGAVQQDGELRKRLSGQRAAISLSNLGNSRVDEFDAIIPAGQSMILGVGRIAPRPFVVNERLELRQTMRLSLALDHRVHDGAPGAEFLGAIVRFLERPALLLV